MKQYSVTDTMRGITLSDMPLMGVAYVSDDVTAALFEDVAALAIGGSMDAGAIHIVRTADVSPSTSVEWAIAQVEWRKAEALYAEAFGEYTSARAHWLDKL